MTSKINTADQSLWGITAYFNPCKYKKKLANYRIFRKFLQIPIITVELSFDKGFELDGADADILVQLPGKDVMWQKERLLNIGLDSLPEECEKTVWLDCDIVFTDSDWHLKTAALLNEYKLIQPYKRVHHLSPDIINGSEITMDHLSAVKPVLSEYSFAYSHVASKPVLEENRPTAHKEIGAVGLMWAARKETLLRHSLYDACIIGGSDTIMALSAAGKFNEIAQKNFMNELQFIHFLDWGKSFYSDVKDSIYYVDSNVFHLWHGDFHDRSYSNRHEILKKYNFDPLTDITLDENACWKWNSEKTGLQQKIFSYFASRKEDG